MTISRAKRVNMMIFSTFLAHCCPNGVIKNTRLAGQLIERRYSIVGIEKRQRYTCLSAVITDRHQQRGGPKATPILKRIGRTAFRVFLTRIP